MIKKTFPCHFEIGEVFLFLVDSIRFNKNGEKVVLNHVLTKELS